MRRGFLLLCSLASAVLAGPIAISIYAGSVVGCSRAALETNLKLDAAPDVVVEPEAEAAPPPPIEASRKVDLLLVVDNSKNLDNAHQILADSVPYLVDRLAHPPCVNGLGNVVARPADPGAPCPVGERDFSPVTDLHLAMISTSLGGHGADLCSPAGPAFDPSQNDAAHLLSRTREGGMIPTYQGQGFLSWDPLKAAVPPGDSDEAGLTAKLVEMVKGAGDNGCGFESQLESFYRFLIDPNPYDQISLVDGKAVPGGTDATVLQQRADFARPDSALVILLLTDENDCSTREGGQYYLAGQIGTGAPNQAFHLPRGRSECAKDPNDPCCASCGQPTPQGCSPTGADAQCQRAPMDALEDPVNLRCFDQKRRFGVDFLYPVDRYIQGLSAPKIADRDGAIVDNPLFTGNRSPKMVIFGGIVGVPWQDIAKDPLSLATGFAPPSEIDWELLLGDPDKNTPPTDPLMISSVDPRMGDSPRAKATLASPTATSALENPVNGHERTIANRADLQYACIYPRQTPLNCAGGACECTDQNIATNPICQQLDGSYSGVQRFSRALPATRELQLIEALGDRAMVGSICAATVAGPDLPTFGYKPSMDAVLRAVRLRIE